MINLSRLLICFFFAGPLFLPSARAQQENSSRFIADGQYFRIFAEGRLEASDIVSRLKFDYLVFGDKLIKGADQDQKQLLVRTVDGLFLEISDNLALHVNKFKGTIRIVPDRRVLSTLIKLEYGRDFNGGAFYDFDRNVILISFQDLTPGLLGHEMARAIISNFFPVPPSPGMQEALSGS